jgi:hypothetical protein
MTRKDYVKIAAILMKLREPFNTTEDDLLDKVAFELAYIFLEDNPRFDEERFYEAAGVTRR